MHKRHQYHYRHHHRHHRPHLNLSIHFTTSEFSFSNKMCVKGFICDYIAWKLKSSMQDGDNWGIFSSHTKYKRAHTHGDDTLKKKIGLSRANKKTHQEGKVNCSLFPGFIACVLNTISFLRWKCSGFLLGNPFRCGIYPIKYKWWCEHEAY